MVSKSAKQKSELKAAKGAGARAFAADHQPSTKINWYGYTYGPMNMLKMEILWEQNLTSIHTPILYSFGISFYDYSYILK